MTTKTMVLKEKAMEQISKGAIVKRGGDLFIVAEMKAEVDPIQTALFSATQSASTGQYRERQFPKNRYSDGLYALISLTTGGNLYGSHDSIDELRYRMKHSSVKFDVVDSVEIKEV